MQEWGTDRLAMEAQKDPRALEKLVARYETFLLRKAAASAGKYITQSDDEWSVALTALYEAVTAFEPGKGSFHMLAGQVVDRRLLDYRRGKRKYAGEISVAPGAFDGDPGEEDQEDFLLRLEVTGKAAVQDQEDLRMEIQSILPVFAGYGFSFFDLAHASPKVEKTRQACARAVWWMMKEPEEQRQMRVTRQLPLKKIEKNAGVPRKILERHRKYIIAAVEILSGEYPCLAGYIRGVGRELEK